MSKHETEVEVWNKPDEKFALNVLVAQLNVYSFSIQSNIFKATLSVTDFNVPLSLETLANESSSCIEELDFTVGYYTNSLVYKRKTSFGRWYKSPSRDFRTSTRTLHYIIHSHSNKFRKGLLLSKNIHLA